MNALQASLLGFVIGLAGYAICGLLFWYNFVNPAVAFLVIPLGLIFLGLAIVSAIAVAFVLLVMLAKKLDHGAKPNG